MEKSKVYFTNLSTNPDLNLLDKLEKLIKKAGIESIDFKSKFAAIKIHFGEPGNLAYLRPNYAAKIASVIKSLGGLPFLTDANTLYSGRRSNALNHLESAYENGFNPFTLGCHIIIADGLKGTDYVEVPLDEEYCKSAKIGTAIMDADIIISMNHFKGHEMTGFGGAIKNVGMGSASRGGKLEIHSTSKPIIESRNCVGCQMCYKSCAHDAIRMIGKKAVIDYDKCVGCGQCIASCMYDAAQNKWDSSEDTASMKIAEYTKAVIKDKPNFHINFIINVSPECDCWSSNDVAIVPDIGIMASFDPVAIDIASADLVNKAPAINTSAVKNCNHEDDKFRSIHSNTDWRIQIDHGVKIGIGSSEYELIEV